MALSRLENLYRQVILDHTNHPRNHGVLDSATSEIELNNPTCGDVVQIQFKLGEGDVIEDIRFTGSGCTISMASTSMMTEVMLGKTYPEALDLIATFSDLVQGKDIADLDELKDAALLNGVAKFPARIKCATLGWKALERGIYENNPSIVDRQLHREEE